jgi:hypothetical protein
MTPEHRRMAAFLAACLKAAKTFAHVHDHDAGRETAIGGVVRPAAIDVIEGAGGVRFSGAPEAVLDHASGKHLQLALEEDGFSGYDYGSETHFNGVFGKDGVVQVYDHETSRWHDFHVS